MLKRLRKVGLYTNIKKYKFYIITISFLRFIVNPNRITIEKERVTIIKS